MNKFVHLHVHSEYSLLDGLPKVKNLVSYIKELGMDSVALTDHGVMHGIIEFYKQCKAQGVKPLVGLEGYIVNGDYKKKEGKADKENNHLVLIAKDYTGYKNLLRLTTIAHLEGFYYRPRFNKELIEKYSEGLICLSSCPKGEIAQLIIDGNYDKAKETALWYENVFGEGNYYLEIQKHQYSKYYKQANEPKIADRLKEMQKNEDVWVEGTIKMSRELGIPLVATNDVHYLKQSDAFAQDVLVCVSTGKLVSDIDRLRYVDTPTYYLRNQEEMAELFHDVPDALENTVKVAEKVNLEMELGKWYFPKFEIPGGKEAPEYLRETAWEKFSEKYPKASQVEKDRLQYELDVIIQKGYAPYFLMMADLVNWCVEQNIATNTRGSAAGSIVSYVLGITSVDPIKYALPFERFLNPFRPRAPDIDLDIAGDRRDDLIGYIVKKYGEDKVAQICTFGTMKARASVRDVGRVLGHPYSFPDKIAKMIPEGSQGFPMTLKHALEISPELKSFYDNDSEAKKILEIAQEIEGNARQASVHAAGIVVSPELMTNYSPLQLEPNGTKIITQYEMHACEDVGLVKFDLLGLSNLSTLPAAVKIIEEIDGINIDLAKLPLDDKKTFEMLARGETMGVFQLGGGGMTKWLKELKPNRIEDIMVMIALFRPGPMAMIPAFIARKNKKDAATPIHPKMKEILDKSYGLLVYQEDVLFTAIELAGYNWETVDKLRTAIGKKIPVEMEKQHEIFVEGCQKSSGMTKVEAEKIWDLFVPFQGYAFNKAHAASYGMVSYQTAYLKANYPVEYMTALLTVESGDTDKVTEGIEECRRMGIVVLPPDINKSVSGFVIEVNDKSIDKKAIRFGFSAIKNVGNTAIDLIIKARDENGEFQSLTELCQRVDQQKVNKKVLESLIKVGAMDKFGNRASMLTGLEKVRSGGELKQKEKSNGQTSMFSTGDEEKKLLTDDDLPKIDEFTRYERLSLEKELLGFYLTEHPLAPMLATISSLVTHKIYELKEEFVNIDKVKIGGIVSSLRIVTTKKTGAEMAFVTIEDQTSKIDAVIFPKVYGNTKSCWVKDQVVLIDGKLEVREEGKTVIVDMATSVLNVNKEEDDSDFTIKIPKGTRPQILVDLNKLLKENPGENKGVLYFENNGSSKKLKLNFGVDYTRELERKIIEMLKPEEN